MQLSGGEFVSLMEFIRSKRQEGGPMKVTFSCEGYLGRYEEKVWENRFQVFRDRRWTRTGSCATCREWKNCRGGIKV